MKTWSRRHFWASSVLVGGLCVPIALCVKVGLFLALPEVAPAFRAGEATAPENKAILTFIRELVLSAALYPFLETLLLFGLPSLVIHKLHGRAGAVVFAVFTGGLGWALHGADTHAVAQGLCFALLGVWFSAVLTMQGRGRAVIATTLAHGTWNASILLLWWIWGRA